MNVAVCDYGAGNVRSVLNALTRIGGDPIVTKEPGAILGADLAVLPGVGSAATAMRSLVESGAADALRTRVGEGKPTLGICLGLQLALDSTEEDGGIAGLAIVPGRAIRLTTGRVPRMGWALVEPLGEAFYFAHSYAATPEAASAYSEGVVAEVRAGSFLGVQFHPEKSGAAGERYLERCLSLV